MSKKIKTICWHVTLFLILNPVISIAMLVLFLVFSNSYTTIELVWNILFATIFAVLTNLSITMGYHRLFAHKSFEAHPVLEAVLLFISAGAFQGSCLKWASDHRIHHRFEDTDKDPYSIKKGFWHAHMGWMMKQESVNIPIHAPDLEKNKLVHFQHKYYLISAIVVGYLLPMLVGALFGSAFLGLVIGGGLRIFLTQQSTFFVNSLSHTLGKTPYSTEKTAKDSLVVAFLTHGEGFHNFHHKFQFDYRNGIRWYHWDPTKWSIQLAYLVGLAKKLKTVNFSEILKARLQVQSEKFVNSKFYAEKLEPAYEKVIQSQIRFEQLKIEYKNSHKVKVAALRAEMKLAQIEFKFQMKRWKILIESANDFAV
ncbi:MAG: acyl-CoA desaturase [Bdellovibrionales bacterium RIFCSPHIGHO2_01_FULL_40_29]|nr:MAG: acyl-CoA desaturase [Bdellovibrionales bacterium RIFCSPHIGHO2_01_FULL_40_29]OFZ35095.1 MAG: acyl-CoA desaturase [Bdellovibrionales bacterium RIFCSPHIGHO2_02_FULL_40_15]